MLFKITLIVAALATSALAVPTGHRSTCSTKCEAGDDKFSYKIGKTYEYRYSAETRTGTSESTDGIDQTQPGIRVDATVQIHLASPCEYVLVLKEVTTDESSNSEKFSTEVTKNSLKFSVKNDKIDAICASEGEPTWVLNFKKGILSTFQNSIKSGISNEVVTETDVSGICETVYESETRGDEVFITKTKVPSECKNKPQASSRMASFGFNMDSIVEGMNPVISDQTCTYILSEDIVKKVTCDEVHTFKPFAHQDGGQVYTAARTTIDFVRVVSGSPKYTDIFDFKTELTYDQTELEQLEDLLSAEEILSKLETASQEGVQKEVPQLFSELVTHMKKLSKYQLIELVTVAGDKHVIKFIFDAMPLVGTTASNEYIVDLIKEGKYSEEDKALYYTSLAFIKNPSEDLFAPLLDLLQHEGKFKEKAMLGISSLVHNYCMANDGCTSVYIIGEIIKHIESYIGVSCRSTDEQSKNIVLVALKSLGNIGRWINSDAILNRCFLENNPTEIRIAAIESWRRAPCSYNRNHLLSTYEDSSYDSEVRIFAYLQVMKCPTQVIVDTIKDRLTSEGVNQVSSFVWSHLNNIQESAAQDKQWIRELIGKDFLKEKYTADALKFSQYFESSLYSKELNVGGSVDADVIFSTDSFIPRSAMLNLTVNLFGQAVNLFEVGGRIEGYEHFIEKFFGPNGYYPDETIEQIIKNMRGDKFEKSPEIENLLGHSSTDPKGSMFVRFLGNELFYTSHLGPDDILSQLGFKSPMDLVLEMVTKGNINFMKSFNLMKSKFSVPTITGFPLQVSFDGSATVGFILDGNFQVDNLNTFELEGKLKPSAALNIDSSMIVDAFVTKTGRKFTTTLHSSTIAEGKAVVKSLKLVDFSLHIPDKDMTVYEYSHDTIRIDDGEEHIEHIESDVDSSCYPSGGTLGIQLCNHVRRTKHGEVLSNKLIAEKMDTHTSYDFHFITDADKFSVMFDMPNSKESNRHKLSYYFDGRNYEGHIHCPDMYMTAKGVVDLKGRNKEMTFHLLDGPKEKELYGAKIALEISNTRSGFIIKPSFNFAIEGNDAMLIEGVITNDYIGKTFEVSSTVIYPIGTYPRSELEFAFNYGSSNKDVTLQYVIYHDMSKSGSVFTVELNGKGEVTEDNIAFMLDGHYRNYFDEKKYIKAAVGLKKEKTPDGTVYILSADAPEVNINTALSLIPANYGIMVDVKISQFHYKFDTYYISKDNDDGKYVAGKIWMDFYNTDISYGIEKTFSMKKNSIESSTSVACGRNEPSFKSRLFYEYGNQFQYMVKIQDFSFNVDVLNERNGKISFESSLKSMVNGDIKGVFEDQSTTNTIDWKINTEGTHRSVGGHKSTYTVQSYLITDGSEFSFDFGLKKRGIRTFYYKLLEVNSLVKITAKATPTSISFSSDLFLPFQIDAKFLTYEDSKKIKAVAKYGENTVEFIGDFSPKKILGQFISNEKTIKFSSQLTDSGLETFIKWAPDQRIDVIVKYNNEAERTSVLISIQTPFKQWLKQEIAVSHALNNHHLDTSVNLIWRNTEHLNFKGKLDWNIKNFWISDVAGQASLTSTLPHFERIKFNIDHKAVVTYDSSKTSKTYFTGEFDRATFTAILNLHSGEGKNKLNFKYSSSFDSSIDLEMTSNWEKSNTEQSLSYKSGRNKSLIKLVTKDWNSSKGKAIFILESPYVPDIDWTTKYDSSRNTNSISTTILLNKKNICDLMLSVKRKDMGMSYEATARIIHPISGIPTSINSAVIMNLGTMEFDFDMSPMTGPEKNRMKFHAKTNIFDATPYDFYIIVHYSGFDTKSSATLIHKIDIVSYEVNSQLNIDFNSFNLKALAEAIVNPLEFTGSLTGTINSSLRSIDGVVFTVKHDVEDNARNTLIEYINGDFNSKVYNSIAYTDAFNWNNALIIGSFLKASNKMSSSVDYFVNELEWNIGEHVISSKFNKGPSGELEASASLVAPDISPIQIQATHQLVGEKGVINGKVVYGEGEKITTQTEYLLLDDYIHLKHEMMSAYYSWTPFEVEFDLNKKINKEASISANAGNIFGITIRLFSKEDVYGGELLFKDKKSSKEISLQSRHFFSGMNKQIYVEGKMNEKLYSASIEYSFDSDELNASSEFKIPCISKETMKMVVYYDLNKKSFKANVINGAEVYDVIGKLEDNALTAEINNPDGKIRIASNWNFSNNIAEIKFDLNCNEHNTEVDFKYSTGYKTEGKFQVSCNGGIYSVNGVKEENSIYFVFTTPVDTYKMRSMLTLSEEPEVEASFSKNTEEFTIKGKGRFDSHQGLATVSILTPFMTSKQTVSVMYSLSDIKELKLEGNISEKIIFVRFIQQQSAHGFKTELEAKLPVKNYEEISLVSINEHNIANYRGEMTLTVMGKQIVSGQLVANSDSTKFALRYVDVVVEGELKYDNGIDFFLNYDDGVYPMSMTFNMDDQNIKGVIQNGDFTAEISATGKISGYAYDLSTSLKTSNNERIFSYYEGQISLEIADQLNFSGIFNHYGGEYIFKYSSSVSSENGFVKVHVKTPLQLVNDFSIDAEYSMQSNVKMAKITTVFNYVDETFFVELQNMDNKFSLKLKTPLKMFTDFNVVGEYDHTNSFYRITGLLNEDNALAIEGHVTPINSGYQIRAQIPTSNGHKIIKGELTKKSISINIIDPIEAKEFISVSYEVDDSKINIQMESSYPEFKKFACDLSQNKDAHSDIFTVIFKIQKDESVYNIEMKTKLNPYDNFIKFVVASRDGEHFMFEWALNTISLDKSVTFMLNTGEDYHFFEGQLGIINKDGHLVAHVDAKSSLKILENFHFENIMTLEDSRLNNRFQLIYNEFAYLFTFGAFEKESAYEIFSRIEDSTMNNNMLSFDLYLNTRTNTVQSKMFIGENVFKVGIELTNEAKKQGVELSVTSPYKEYENFIFKILYDQTKYKNVFEIDIKHNTPVVEVRAVLSTDIKKPEIHLKINTLYTDHIEVRASLNSEDSSDLINIIFKLSDSTDYAFSLGYAFNIHQIAFSMKFKCPHYIFGNIYDFDVAADFNFEENRNSVKCYFENNGEVHIDVKGVYFDDETSISIHMPNEILGNFKTRASFNRDKRSIEMQMMNDHHVGELEGNFHSIKMNLQTPFKRLQKGSFSLVKDKNGKWIMNYKRNDNYINYEIGRTKKGMESKIDLQVPAWELLALTGRLTEEELEGYLTGKLPESKLSFSGKAVFGKKKGEATYQMNAPEFPTLKKASAKFDYNVRRGTYTFDAKSSTNKSFKIFLQFKRGGLFIDVFVPHKETPTVIKGQLTIFKGKLNMSSRFPAFKTYELNYSIEIRKTVDIKSTVQRNGVQVFNLDFHKGPEKNHFLVERRRQGTYTKFHYHRMGWNHLDLVLHRDGHEFSANLKGSGNLPLKGEIDFIIKNSFRLTPREVTGSVQIDRTGSPKRIVLRVEKSPAEVFTVTAVYNIDLKNLKKGDLNIKVDTPKRHYQRWNNINLIWEFDETKTGNIKLNVANREYKLNGKLSLKESDFVVSCNIPGLKSRVYGWKIEKRGNYRDYMIKFGPETSYTLVAISGTASDIRNVDVKGRIKSRFAKHELKFTAKWSGNKDVGISGDGTFEIGKKKGAFKLHRLKRDPVKRASSFRLTGKSNIKGFSSYSIIGEYDLSARMVDVKIKWDTDELSLYTKIDNFTAKKSQNSAKFHIPGVGPSEVNFGHDFTNPLDKRIKMDGNLGGKPFHYYEHWTRNAQFTLFNLDVDIKSNFIGVIKMTASYDVRDVNNAKGNIVYTRDGKNNVNVNWHRTQTDNSIVNEIVIDSKASLVPNSKAYFKANWEKGTFFTSAIGLEWAQKKLEAHLNIDKKMAKFYTKTPFPNVDDIMAVLKYDVDKKIKTVTLNYERGERKANFSFVLNYKSKNKGSVDISITTPFAIIKKLKFNAKWNKGKFDAHYQRNDKKIDVAGKADIKQGKSSYDFVFTPKSGNPVHIKLNYDLVDFFKKTSKKEQQILHLDVDMGEQKVSVNVNGYRTMDKIIMHTEGTSSLDFIKTFSIRLDSELNLSNREGLLDIKINDFEYKMKNKFEKFDNGYYFRSQIHSTLTRLPGLTLGYGKDGKDRKITLGYGDEREFSVTINGKDEFKKGIFGKIDIPRRGIIGMEFDITYDFIGEDKFSGRVELRLKSGKKITYELDYHSHGVKSRISGPMETIRRLRAKRSPNDDFNMEDYSITYQSSSGDNIMNKGILIEGQIFGKPFSVDTYLNLKEATNSQGKLLIKTPFEGYEKLGGHFVIKQEDQKLRGHGELFFHGHAVAEFETNMRDVNSKKVIGTVTYTPLENAVPVSIGVYANIKEEQSVVNINLKPASSLREHNIVLKISPGQNGQHIKVTYNDYAFDAEYQLHASPFYFKLNSKIQSGSTVIHKCTLQTSFDKQEFSLKTDISANQRSHNLNVGIVISSDLHNIDVNYENLDDCSMKVTYIKSGYRTQVNLLYRGANIHSINYNLVGDPSYNNLNLEMDSQYLPKLQITAVFRREIKTVEIGTKWGVLGIEYEWLSTKDYANIKVKGKFIGDSSYVYAINIFSNYHGYELLGKFSHNDDEYLFNGKYMLEDTDAKLYLDIVTPSIPVKTSFIKLIASLKNGIKLSVETSLWNVLHKVHLVAENQPKMITLDITSPIVPTGQAKVKLYLEGNSVDQSEMEILLSNARVSYFCRIISKFDFANENAMELILRTPISGFEDIRFGGGYKTGNMKEIYIYAQPFNYKADFFLGKEINTYKIGFEVVAESEILPVVAVKAIIPMNKINPHFSAKYGEKHYDVEFMFNNTDQENEVGAMFTQNGLKTGGNIHITKHYPMEIEYMILHNSEPITKFHIMADSSFTNAAYLLL